MTIYCIPADFPNPLEIKQLVSDGAGTFEKPVTFDDLDIVGDGVNTIYVDYVAGNDTSNFGTNPATPIKTMNRALVVAGTLGPGSVYIRILLLDRILGRNSFSSTSQTFNSEHVKVESGHVSGRTIFCQNDDTLAFAWTDNLDGSFSSSAAGVEALQSAFDDSNRDSRGLPGVMTVATSKANCQATANSWYWSGTEITVHMFDGRSPDSDWLIASVAEYNRINWVMANSFNLFINGIVHIGPRIIGSGNVNFKGSFKNVWALGGNRPGFDIRSNGMVFEDCGGLYLGDDIFDYDNALDPANTCNYEINCTGLYVADSNYVSGATPTESQNCSTLHDGNNLISVNCEYAHAHGPIVSDVGGGSRWMFGCNAYGREGGAGVDGTAETDGVYVMRGGGTMYLVECEGVTTSSDGASPFLFTNVEYRNWLGETPVTSYNSNTATENDALGACGGVTFSMEITHRNFGTSRTRGGLR